MARGGVAIGVVTRTGSAVAVVLSGVRDAPTFETRHEMGLIAADLPADAYHVAAGLELADAAEMIGHVERSAEEFAVRGLHAAAGGQPAVLGVAVVVKAVSLPASLSAVLRSHAWMHAAEGLLYREAVLAAARRSGWPAHAVDASALSPADQVIGALGRAAGRPWRSREKDAARAALTLLP